MLATSLIEYTTVRDFYRRYLKKYPIFREINIKAHALFRTIARFYATGKRLAYKHLSPDIKAIKPIGPYLAAHQIPYQVIHQSEQHKTPGPQFFTAPDCTPYMPEQVTIEAPEIRYYCLNQTSIIGSTSFLEHNQNILIPDQFDLDRDMSWMELRGLATIKPSSAQITFYQNKKIRRRLNTAINLVGQCSGNYAHFLTEILVKLALADKSGINPDIPILVDGWINDIFFRILELFNFNKRPIIRVGLFEKVLVDELIHITGTAYIPAESRLFFETNKLPLPNGEMFLFSPYALEEVRKAAFKITTEQSPKNINSHPYIYLKRNSSSYNQRLLTTEQEIEKRATKLGLRVIDPVDLDFLDQISLFQNSRIIVSPIGAALANSIFSPQGTTVIALAPYYENANYFYFTNLMASLRQNLHFVVGKQCRTSSRVPLIHQNYEVDADLFEATLIYALNRDHQQNDLS